MIAEARQEARAAGCAVTFDVGDAESLPYLEGQFDTTVTMFGAMFAYRPDRAAAELLRVTRSGGRVAMANWTPGGFVGRMLRAHTAVVPPPPGLPGLLEWGKEAVVRERFGAGASRLRSDLTRLFEEANRATDGTTPVAAEYLDVQARVA